jgi:hypothetical protein
MILLQFPEHPTVEQINRGRELIALGNWKILYYAVLKSYEKTFEDATVMPTAS